MHVDQPHHRRRERQPRTRRLLLPVFFGRIGHVSMIVPMAEKPVREVIHRGARFDFELVAATGRDGVTNRREVVRHPGAVVVLPLLPDGRIALIRNRRIAVEADLWELPAGTLEPGEDPARCAARELEEEAGYTAGRVRKIGAFYTTPGMTDELMRAYLATDLRQVGQRLEADEQIEVHILDRQEALNMIESGELMDAKSMLALLIAERRGLLTLGDAREDDR
ncbi:MAG: NUDIX hydrolase [Phycisphaeraceae bacterium]|nr:MAG: NUDIX hydrolase [Phycisphaeraceae bacterium]